MKNAVVKNASWIILCRIIQSLLAFFIGMLTARYLGPSNYGLVNYAASVVAFALPFMQLGFNSILVQELVEHPEKEGETLGTALLSALCSSIACIGGVTAFAALASHGERETVIVCLLYSIILVFQAVELLQYWFQAKLLSKYTSVVMLCAYIVTAMYRVYLLATQKSIYWFAVSNAFDAMLIAVALLFIYKRLGGHRLSASVDRFKSMFTRSKHFILSSLMITVFAQTDKIMLKLMLDEASTGFYSAALTCATASSFVFTAILDSMRPSILANRKKDIAQYEKRMVALYSIVIYLSLAQCIAMTALADIIIGILYGVQYAPAAGALRLVVWFSTFSYIGGVRSIWILAENQQKHFWKINLSGAIVNVLLNAIMIPVCGIYGAAIASIVTQVFTNVITSMFIRSMRRNNVLLLKALDPRNIISLLKRKDSVQ